MKRALLLAVLALGACKDMGLSSLDTDEAANMPGISNLNTETDEEKKQSKWFKSFYGSDHGWGTGKAKDSEDCSYWGNCTGSSGPTGSNLGW